MNILHIIDYPGTGGAEKYITYLSYEARKSGNNITFVFGKEGPGLENMATSPKNFGDNQPFKYKIIKMKSWYDLTAVFILKKYFTENNIDIVHTHFLREHFLSVFAKIFGAKIKIIRTFHRLDQLPLKVRPFYKLIQLKTDSFIAISNYLKNQMIINGITNKKISVVYNGVPKVEVKKRGAGIGYLGRLSKEKGILEFAKLYNLDRKLVIAGDGPDLNDIKLINNKNIILLGNIDNIAEFFEQISVMVLPSSTEVMSLSALEAYSANIPVITFDLESLTEVIPDKYQAKYGDFLSIIKLAGKTALINNTYAYDLYKKKFTIERMWAETEKVYLK